MIFSGIGVVLSWRLNEWLSTNSDDGVESEDEKIPKSKTVEENYDSGDDTNANHDVDETVSVTDVDMNVQDEDNEESKSVNKNVYMGTGLHAKDIDIVNDSKQVKDIVRKNDIIKKYSFLKIPTFAPVFDLDPTEKQTIKNLLDDIKIEEYEEEEEEETEEKETKEKEKEKETETKEKETEEEDDEDEISTKVSAEIETKKNVTTDLALKYKSMIINIVYLLIAIVKYTLATIDLEDNILSTTLTRKFNFDIKSGKVDIEFINSFMDEIIETVMDYEILQNIMHLVLRKKIDKISNEDILETIRTIIPITNSAQENIEINNYINYTLLFEVLSKIILDFEISQIVPETIKSNIISVKMLQNKETFEFSIPWMIKTLIFKLVVPNIKFNKAMKKRYSKLFNGLKVRTEYTYSIFETFIYDLLHLLYITDLEDINAKIIIPDNVLKKGEIKYVIVVVIYLLLGLVKSFISKVPTTLISTLISTISKFIPEEDLSVSDNEVDILDLIMTDAHNLTLINRFFRLINDRNDNGKDCVTKENIQNALDLISNKMFTKSQSIENNPGKIAEYLKIAGSLNFDLIFEVATLIIINFEIDEIIPTEIKQYKIDSNISNYVTKFLTIILNSNVFEKTERLKKYGALISKFVNTNIYDYKNIKSFLVGFYELIVDEKIEDIEINETEPEIKTFGTSV
jgi:hypothetical protein